MQHTQRLIFLALAVAWTIFRLVRYVQVANAKRAGPAVPPSSGVLPPPAAPATVQSPIGPAGGTGSGLAGFLAAAGILVAGNAVIWPVLFLLPAFEAVPSIWRLTAGVVANLFLIRVASKAAARARGVSQQGSDDERNPIR